MYELPSNTGSVGGGEVAGKDRDLAETSAGKNVYKDIIRRADSIPLITMFSYYGIRLDKYNRKTTCPFKSHKGGREKSASFYYYPETNSFRCYGCNTGNPGAHSTDFVAAMDGLRKINAAYKIIGLFGSDIDDSQGFVDRESFSEQIEIMLDFSTSVREFRSLYYDEKSHLFIENMCQIYDAMCAKRNNNNKSLQEISSIIKNMINRYQI